MDSFSKPTRAHELAVSGSQLQLPILDRCAFLKSQRASRITWHSHDCFEILIVLEGSVEYEFQQGESVTLVGGQFLTIPPGIIHRGKHNVRRPARLLGLLFDLSSVNAHRNTPFTKHDLKWLLRQMPRGAGPLRRINAEIREYVRSIASLLETGSPANPSTRASIRIAVCAILLEIANQLAVSGTLEPDQVVKIAIDYMKSHLKSEVSIEHLAKEAQCSRAKLFAAFKKSTGMTPNDYWLRLRVDHAQFLLRTTRLAVTRVAIDSGFSTSQYFSTVFRKYTGMSPTEYRVHEGVVP